MPRYTDQDREDIEQELRDIDHVKTIVRSPWWPDFTRRVTDEMINLVDGLHSMQWTYENLARFAGKLYGMRLIIKDPEQLLFQEENIKRGLGEINEG